MYYGKKMLPAFYQVLKEGYSICPEMTIPGSSRILLNPSQKKRGKRRFYVE
jgi:hypothetical protein